MSCQNCYNGCSEIIPDRCIRYTGDNIPSLGIETGDSLSKIELSLSTFLISTLNGTGIHPTIDPDIICALVGGIFTNVWTLNHSRLCECIDQS